MPVSKQGLLTLDKECKVTRRTLGFFFVRSRKLFLLAAAGVLALVSAGTAHADFTQTFTASDIINLVNSTGDSLVTSNASYGVFDIIVKPDISGSFTVSNPTTSLGTGSANWTGWIGQIGTSNYVYDPSHYQANQYVEFQFQKGGVNGEYIISPVGSAFPSTGGLNPLSLAALNATFSFNVSGTSQSTPGGIRFEISGYKNPAGNTDPNLLTTFAPTGSALYELQHNQNGGYPGSGAVPIPGALWLLGSGLVGLIGFRKKIGAR